MNPAFRVALFFVLTLVVITYITNDLFAPDVSGVKRTGEQEISYFGPIDPDRVEQFKSMYRPGDRLRIQSTGGHLQAGMDFGNFITTNRIDVEVADYCISSCANYVFLAGQRKILNQTSLVIFHGGPKQENFLYQLQMAFSEEAKAGDVFGVEGYEAVISLQEARRRPVGLSRTSQPTICDDSELSRASDKCVELTPEQHHGFLTELEDLLYQKIDPMMDKNIPYYGQRGRYQEIYESYRFVGFYYSLESLDKLNVKNVMLKKGTWLPEKNPLNSRVYKVEV